MDVSIIIRTKNEAESIGNTLKRIEEQTFGGTYEVLVVDSGSTDRTVDVVKKYDTKLVQIPQKEFSYGRALNVGASEAKGEFVVNLSAHALPMDEMWLANLIDGFWKSDVVAVYGKQISVGHLNPFEAWLNEVFFGEERIRFDRNKTRLLKSIHFTNSNAAIRKDVWRKFRFNERTIYGEDIIWQGKIIEAGLSILYVPTAVVCHTHRVSIPSVYRNSINCEYNMAVMQRRRRWLPLIMGDLVLFCALLARSMVQNVSYILRHKYYEHLGVAPFWVLSGSLGTAVGRISYRMKRELW